MRFKIDENLPPIASKILQDSGHDAITVLDQKMGGKSDFVISEAVRNEERTLITLDLDFADIRTYPPGNYSGIIVLRLHRQDKSTALLVLRRLLSVF